MNVTVQQSFWGRLTGAPRVFVVEYRESLSHGAGISPPCACISQSPKPIGGRSLHAPGSRESRTFAITETSRWKSSPISCMLKLEAIRPEPRELSLDAPRDLQLTRLLERGRVDPVALLQCLWRMRGEPSSGHMQCDLADGLLRRQRPFAPRIGDQAPQVIRHRPAHHDLEERLAGAGFVLTADQPDLRLAA